MLRALLIAAISAALLGACTQYSNNADQSRGSGYRHGGGDGPSFSSRILP